MTDGGVSGATRPAERPGFARVMELAQANAFAILLVYKFDRLAREIRYAVTTVADLAEQHDIGIRSVTEPIDTATPMGRTVFAILAGMAESERFTIRDRTAGGKLSKAGRGGFAGGRAPYGYATDREGGLRIVPEQAAIVRRIFKERGRGRRPARTLQAIAAGLNADGIPSPTGKLWRHDGVSYVLDNRNTVAWWSTSSPGPAPSSTSFSRARTKPSSADTGTHHERRTELHPLRQGLLRVLSDAGMPDAQYRDRAARRQPGRVPAALREAG